VVRLPVKGQPVRANADDALHNADGEGVARQVRPLLDVQFEVAGQRRRVAARGSTMGEARR
jgi:hypothetical protein